MSATFLEGLGSTLIATTGTTAMTLFAPTAVPAGQPASSGTARTKAVLVERPGRVQQIIGQPDATTAYASLDLARNAGPLSFKTVRSLVTSIGLSQATNQQVAHALGGDIYIYVFGDQIGQMTVGGISLAGDCDASGKGIHGIEQVYQFYRTNRLSRRREALPIAIGSTMSFSAFLVGLQMDISDPVQNIARFQLQMMIIPPKDP